MSIERHAYKGYFEMHEKSGRLKKRRLTALILSRELLNLG